MSSKHNHKNRSRVTYHNDRSGYNVGAQKTHHGSAKKQAGKK